MLYVIPTPIGNLKDITLRALELLQEVDYILCEDTRTSLKLFRLLDLNIDVKKLYSLHKFNESSKIETIIKNIKDGKTYALVSDAGMPTISDPGQRLVNLLKSEKIKVEVLPGPSSIITALAGSGRIYKQFTFVGFFDRTESKILKQIEKNKQGLIVAFESPHRISKTLEIIQKNYGDIEVTIARELSKKFEENTTDKISNLLKNVFKGEIIIMFDLKN